MAIACTVKDYLSQHRIAYEVLPHSHTMTSLGSAQAAGVDADRLAKAVVLEDELGYLMAVLPASHHFKLGSLRNQTGRHIQMARETEMLDLFKDCAAGAVPALGAAYGIETIWDDSLQEQPDIYFEAGDHEQLVHLSGKQFLDLLGTARHGHFSSRD